MKIQIVLFVLAVLAPAFIISSCQPDPEVLPERPFEFKTPKDWPQPFYRFEGNTLSKEGFDLGKKLFFDGRLARDNQTSCGSCHQPFSAFAQIGHDFSHGVDNRLGERNSPGLFNLSWHSSFFWDGGVNHIEIQPLNPIQNPVEMDEKLENIIGKLKKDDHYPQQFKTVFGDETISTQRIFKALTQFMGMLISDNSRYDKYMRAESGGALTEPELRGLNIFRSHCASCHKEPLFSDFSFRNNGLSPGRFNDSGRARVTLNPEDLYLFKVPSLRNLRYTAPYMHDGRFRSLKQVMDHYSGGISNSPTLDPLLKSGISLTETEKADLIQFLNTLNDEDFVANPLFQELK